MSQGYDWNNLRPGFPDNKNWFSGIFSIVARAPWAYLGFDCIPQAAEEYKFKHRKSLRIMIIAILCAAAMYIMVNTVTAIVMPWQELLESKPFWATGLAVEIAVGKVGLFVLGIAMFCAVISGINAFYISTSRLMYSMAKMHALPKLFGRLNKRHGTPQNAIIFVMLVSLVAPWFGREVLGWIVDMTSVGAAIVFAYTTASAARIAHRHRFKYQRFIGILGCLLSLFFLSLLVVPGMPGFLGWQSRVILGIWLSMGVIFYIMTRKKYLASPTFDENNKIQ
jgi:amino acid transporter